jgi:hypothetical protein
MCITAAVAAASLVVSAAGTIVAIDAANYQNSMTQLQLEEQRKQYRQEQKNQRLQAQEAEIERLRAYREQREENLLALAGSGAGQSMSFMQGISQQSDKNLRRDLANIRMGFLGGQNRIAQQIRVNKTQSMISNAQQDTAVLSAGINFASEALSIGNFYEQNRPRSDPKAPPKKAASQSSSRDPLSAGDFYKAYGG